MRKENREIKNISDIVALIDRINTIRIGMCDTPFPYVVPVSFGYTCEDDGLSFFFHGAKEGKKATLLARHPQVCIEGDLWQGFMDTGSSVTCLYESFIAFGTATLVSGQEALDGLAALLDHCGYKTHPIDAKALPVVNVYKVCVQSITGKRRTKDT